MLRAILQFFSIEIARQRKSLFLWSPVILGLGIIAFFQYNLDLSTAMVGAGLFFSALALSKSVYSYAKTGQNRWLWVMLVSLSCLLFVTGYAAAQYRTYSLDTVLLEDNIPPIMVEGTIEKLVYLDGGKAKRVILHSLSTDNNEIKLSRVRLKTYHFKGDSWNNGDRVRVKAKLQPPSGPVMVGGFDFRFKAYYEGLGAVGYTMGDAQLISISTSNSNQIEGIRGIIGSHLYHAMEDRNAGIAQALLTGERAGMAKDDVAALRTSGLAHLLAISGLHIGLVAGCVFFFVRLFLACIPNMALYHPIKKYAAACAIIIALTYMILAGATVPTVRAFIMTSLVLLAIILDRSALNMRLVALAAIIVMLTTPEAIMGPSFVLSFAAVAGLIAFYQGIGRQWLVNARAYHPLWRPIYYIAGVVATTIIATLATAPFSVMFFNRFAVYSVISNFVAMPIMAFIVMPFGLLSTLLIPLGMDEYSWPVMEWGIQHITQVAHAVSSYKNADLYLPSFGTFETILICVGYLWLILWRGILRWFGVVIILVAFIIPHIGSMKTILIDEKMRSLLIVNNNGDNPFLIGKMSRYVKSNWLNSLGYSDDVDILNYNRGDNIPSSLGHCDDAVCYLEIDAVKIAIVINPLFTVDACKNSDLVITKIPMVTQYCTNAHVIDRFDVWRHGATTITFNNGRYNIETVK